VAAAQKAVALDSKSSDGRREAVVEWAEARVAPSSALYLGPDCRKVVWRRTAVVGLTLGTGGTVGEAKANRSGARRSTGARVESR
jgi:hypothetical protein